MVNNRLMRVSCRLGKITEMNIPSSHWADVTAVKESGDAVGNIMLRVASSSMTGLEVGQ